MPLFPSAQRHGDIEQVFDDVFFVTGSVRMPGPLPVRFSRNMTILRQGDALTLVGTMRLNDAGLQALDALGKVEHIVRVAGFHGMDDPFYRGRYGAKVWAVEGQAYAKGFDAPKTAPADGYFQPDVWMSPSTELPISGARLVTIRGAPPEGVLRVDVEGGILITGDSLQNWEVVDDYFSTLGGLAMRAMGFIKAHNVGPGWLRGAKPDRAQVKSLLDLEFEHVLPVHGAKVIGGAREKYRPAIERL